MIAKIGIDIIRQVSPTLMDERAMPVDQLEEVIKTVPGVLSVHHVRSRGHDSAVYADLHIDVDAGMSTDQAHAIAHEVQYRVRERFSNIQDVTIHVEPGRAHWEKLGWEETAVELRRLADGLGLGVHDVWGYDVKGHHYAEVHLEADGALTLRQAHALASSLEERACAEIPRLAELTTHIEPKGQLTQMASSSLEEYQVLESAQRLVSEIPGAASCHQMQVHRSGDGWAISLHCHLPGEIPLTKAHEFSTHLETRLCEQLPGLRRVVIHTEPDEVAVL
jgi:divalent metal cation (Fe/Co/Zn/Cd) transporter